MAAINSMCYRALNCTKNKKESKKMDTIKNIIESNNWKPNTVNKIVRE